MPLAPPPCEAAAVCPPSSASVAVAGSDATRDNALAPARRGLARVLTDAELDEFFRIRSELFSSQFGEADAELLLPFMRKIYGAHNLARGNNAAGKGGFVDVGANVGSATALILSWLAPDYPARVYHAALAAGSLGPALTDSLHGLHGSDRLPFLYALEGSARTRELLERRAAAGVWKSVGAEVLPLAASNASGTARFCAYTAGSGQSGLGGGGSGGAGVGGREQDAPLCEAVPTVRVDDLVDERAGVNARVFFLKIDVEGAEALVLLGSQRLFKAQRVAYVLFENNAKWEAAQADLGLSPAITVGDVAAEMHAMGYACFFTHFEGLVPLPVKGTPAGDAPRPGCSEGLPFCARHRLYNRKFWSNVLCAAPSEAPWVDWLQDALVSPVITREALLSRK